VTKHNQQADGEIHEDQLLNFLVNTLTGAFGLTLGENADIDLEDIYEVLVGATTDGTSISTLCERANDAPPHSLSPKRMILVSKFINSAKTDFKRRSPSARRLEIVTEYPFDGG
jgi:hypothetical protein